MGVSLSARSRLQQLVNWEVRPRRTMRAGLEPARDLLRRLGDPQHRMLCVHVTGTKGKGSVCALIEHALLGAGLRAGRYASPHVETLNERVCIAGAPVDDATLDRALEKALDAHDAACDDDTPAREATWFDVVTAAAFTCFADAGLEWAVVEVGLGGLLDSTNVVWPQLAVITNVELEHVDVLGPTLQDIARHKAGIGKPGRLLLSGVAPDHPARPVIATCAQDARARLVEIDLRGFNGIAPRNVALARAALALLGAAGHRHPALGRRLGAADLPDGLAADVRLPGRLECIELPHPCTGEPMSLPGHPKGEYRSAGHEGAPVSVVLDGAHVAFAVSALLDEVQRHWRAGTLPVVVLALAADKPAHDIIARLAGRVRAAVCTSLPGERSGWSADALAVICQAQGVPARAEPDPRAALDAALAMLSAGDGLLVTGSLSIAGWVRGRLRAA